MKPQYCCICTYIFVQISEQKVIYMTFVWQIQQIKHEKQYCDGDHGTRQEDKKYDLLQTVCHVMDITFL